MSTIKIVVSHDSRRQGDHMPASPWLPRPLSALVMHLLCVLCLTLPFDVFKNDSRKRRAISLPSAVMSLNQTSTYRSRLIKAGVYMNRSEILSIIKRELLGLK